MLGCLSEMNDLETLQDMLERASVVFTRPEPDPRVKGAVSALRVEALDGPRNRGYPQFISILSFDGNGALISWATWE